VALDALARPLALLITGAPAALVLLLGGACLLERPFAERTVGRLAALANTTGLSAVVALAALMISRGQ
jgi:hypothetical protein